MLGILLPHGLLARAEPPKDAGPPKVLAEEQPAESKPPSQSKQKAELKKPAEGREHIAERLAAARRLALTGKYAEAIDAYHKLAEHAPRAGALGEARATAAVGEYAKAAELLDKALAVKDAKQEKEASRVKDSDLHAELARLAFDRGDYPACDREFEAALAEAPDHLQARWIAAERLRVAGKLDEALKGYQWFVDYYNRHDVESPEDLHTIGLAAAQFARWKRLSEQFTFLVNELYPGALEVDEEYWPAHYEAGLLFLEKFNEAEANRAFKAALAINPSAAEVYAAIARLALQNFDIDTARRALEQAKELNPNLFEAHLYRADVELATFETQAAITTLERALKINPVDERALGRLASAYLGLDGWPEKKPDTRFQKLAAEVNARNPHAGDFYFALGSTLDLTRRYPAAAHFYQQAVERMPELIETRAALGMTQMRLGDETSARKQLDESFATDPFNVRVSNTLKVLEVLDTYAVLETEHFVIKFDRGRDEILATYAAKYLEEQVYPALTKQFAFVPPGKSLFEIFHRARNTSGHGWFSARMVGLPSIGTVGACAGKMVAMASPNDMPQKFNWARVLKHEFVHVLNLQQTNFNIPHWYTEALAVENEGYPRPQQWNEMLAERVPKGQMYNLDNLNVTFVRPGSSENWSMAYCQAQLYAQYMLKTYGPDALARLLAAYADNLDTRAALLRAFQVKQEDFERGYLEFVKAIVAELQTGEKSGEELSFARLTRAQQEKPDDTDLMARLGLAHLERKDYPEARKLARAALDKAPKQGLAGYVLARVWLVIGENEQAYEALTASLDKQHPNSRALHLLAGLELKLEHYDEAARLYELGTKQFPNDPLWAKSLVRLYLKSGEKTKLVPLLSKLAESDADDLVMRKKLAQLAVDAHDYAAARRWSQDALHIDVLDVDSHRTLADSCVELNDYPAAIDEYRLAIKLAPREGGLRFSLADALVEAKQPAAARTALRELLEIEPEFPGARLMLDSLAEPADKP